MLKLTDTLTNENCRPTTGWVYLASSATPAEEKTSLLCLVRSEDFYTNRKLYSGRGPYHYCANTTPSKCPSISNASFQAFLSWTETPNDISFWDAISKPLRIRLLNH